MDDDFYVRTINDCDYIIVDRLGEYPIKKYSRITRYKDSNYIKLIDAIGAVRKYFQDNGIKEKVVKSWHNPYDHSEIFGQPDHTTGRFILFYDWDIDRVKSLIKSHTINKILRYQGVKLYNKKGYYLSTKTNKEIKESEKHKEASTTFIIKDLVQEYKTEKIKAKNAYQAIRQYFKNNNIKEKPFNWETLWSKQFTLCNENNLWGRFKIYNMAAPRNTKLYNRKGYAVKNPHFDSNPVNPLTEYSLIDF